MQKELKIPKLRFPEFADPWEAKKLGEVGEIVTGLTYSPHDISEKGVLVLRSSNIQDNQLSFEDNVFVNASNYNPVIVNDILICVRNGSKRLIGKNVLIPKDKEGLAFGAFMVVFRSQINLFLIQLFSTKKYYKIISENLGATINSINNNDLKKFKFYFPSVAEQNRIASFFTSVDKKITELKQKKKLLEQYKKGVMQRLFSQELRFKDDNGNNFPKWEKKKLGEVAKFSKGKGISKIEIAEDGKFECIRYGELYTHYREVIDTIKSKTNVNEKDLIFSEANDVIIPASGESQIDIAKASCVLKPGIALGGDLNIIKTKNNGVFLSYYLNIKKKKDIANLAQGISVVHLYSSQLTTLNLELPSLPEQTKIANFLSVIEEKLNRIENQIQQTQMYKKGLLQNMFI